MVCGPQSRRDLPPDWKLALTTASSTRRKAASATEEKVREETGLYGEGRARGRGQGAVQAQRLGDFVARRPHPLTAKEANAKFLPSSITETLRFPPWSLFLLYTFPKHLRAFFVFVFQLAGIISFFLSKEGASSVSLPRCSPVRGNRCPSVSRSGTGNRSSSLHQSCNQGTSPQHT